MDVDSFFDPVYFGEPAVKYSDKKYVFTYWYPSGKLKEEYTVIDGKRQGDYRAYYEDGSRMDSKTYRDDVVWGERHVWNKSSKIYTIVNYEDGKKHGSFEQYYMLDDGKEKLLIHSNCQNDLFHGSFRSFHLNGKINVATTFFNGKKHGRMIKYNSNGTLVLDCMYVVDILTNTIVNLINLSVR